MVNRPGTVIVFTYSQITEKKNEFTKTKSVMKSFYVFVSVLKSKEEKDH